MGLDTTHNCWHGPYSSFNSFRVALCQCAGYGLLDNYEGFGGTKKWDMKDPLCELLYHSDCDGEIKSKLCKPIAERLEQCYPAMLKAGYGLQMKRFIDGLYEASAKKQDVEFH